MKLSTKGRYAVTAMMDIANNHRSGPVALADISRSQGISLSYLEQLFAKLRRCGLVEGVRGPGGGYRLARPANRISMAEIIAAVDETVDMTHCGGKANCHGSEACRTHAMWNDLSARINAFLASISLEDFVASGSDPSPDMEDVEPVVDSKRPGRINAGHKVGANVMAG